MNQIRILIFVIGGLVFGGMIVAGVLASKRGKQGTFEQRNSEPATSMSAPPPPPAASARPPPAPRASAAASGRPTAAVVIARVVHPAPTPGPKTTERLAADALHAGDFPRAEALYKELAAACPQNPAFANAERILKARNP